VALAGGLNAAPAASLASTAASVMAGVELHVEARYHLAWRPEYGMALAAIAVGATLLLAGRLTPADRWLRSGALLARVGPERLYTAAMAGLTALSSRLHDLEVRDLRMRAAAVLVPGGCLIFAALASSPLEHGFRVGALGADVVPLVAALGAAAVAAVAATRPLRHPPLIVLLSTASFSMAIVFAMFGAPDVALVAVLVQTVQTLLLVGILSLFHPRASRGASRAAAAQPKRYSAVGWLSGAASFGLTWAIVSWQASAETPERYVDRAPDAHAGNVVTAVLTDFRGLDTMGEATVMAVALLGAAALLGKGRHR
jgi:multicomponent Na+:H+ antiporter subunit A